MNDHGEGLQLIVGASLIVWCLVCVVTVVFVVAQLLRAFRGHE